MSFHVQIPVMGWECVCPLILLHILVLQTYWANFHGEKMWSYIMLDHHCLGRFTAINSKHDGYINLWDLSSASSAWDRILVLIMWNCMKCLGIMLVADTTL